MEESAPSSKAWWKYLALAGVLVVAFGLSLLAGYQWTRQRASNQSTTNLTDTAQQELSPGPISLQVRSELVVAPIQPQLDTDVLKRWWQIIGVNSQALTLKELGGKTNYTPSRVEIIFKDITPLSKAERANLYKPVSGMPGTPIMAGLSTQAGSDSLTYTVWYAPEIVADGSSPEVVEQRLNLQLFEVLYEAAIGSTELTRDDYDAKREKAFPRSEDNPSVIIRLEASQSNSSSSSPFWSGAVVAASHLIERVQQWRLVPQAHAQVCGGKFKCGNTSYNCICSSTGNTCSGNGASCGGSNPGTCNCGTTCVQNVGPLEGCTAAYQTCGIPNYARCSQCEAQNTCGWTVGDPPPPPASCGNGTCGTGESCSNCPADCGECVIIDWAYITVTVYGENDELQAPTNKTAEQTTGSNRCRGYGFTSSTSGKKWNENGNCQSVWALDMNKTDKSMRISGINSMYYGCEVRLNGTLITSSFSNGTCTVPTRTYNQYNDSLVVKLLKATTPLPTPTVKPPICTDFIGPTSVSKGSTYGYEVKARDPDKGTANGAGIGVVQLYWRYVGDTSWNKVSADEALAPYNFNLNTNDVAILSRQTSRKILLIANVYEPGCVDGDAKANCRTTGNPDAASTWTESTACSKEVTVTESPVCSIGLPTLSTANTCSGSDKRTTVSWDAVKFCTQYEVQKATNAAFTANLSTNTTSGTSLTYSGLTRNIPHYFRARCKTKTASSSCTLPSTWSSVATAMGCGANPTCDFTAGPTIIVAGRSGSFTATSNNASVLQMRYRQGTSGDWTSLATAQTGTNPSMTANFNCPSGAAGRSYQVICNAYEKPDWKGMACEGDPTAAVSCGNDDLRTVTCTAPPTPSCSLDLNALDLNPRNTGTMTATVTSESEGTVNRVDFSSNNTGRVSVSPSSDTTRSNSRFTTTATANGNPGQNATITARGFINGVERCNSRFRHRRSPPLSSPLLQPQ